MPGFNNVISLFSTRPAPDQGGLFSGQDPAAFNAGDPLRLWIIQVGIIICTASFLSLVLSKIRQPKVIAEVLGGILLGPTAFGRIPGFTEHIFPPSSRPYLTLVANIGLCLFLFLVGLEIDAGVIKRNARLSAIVAVAGMMLPFGIGSCLSLAIYRQFIDPDIKFTHFMLFAGVAYSITAFPVLCRILTELKLLDTTVGIVVLSAGVGNDIVGWVLLALSVALVNAGSGLTALYILLACLAWTTILLFPVKIALGWLATRTGSIQNGPSVFFMTVTMLILFGSAFLTDFIGVHAIFGAFVAGLIVPREGGLAIAMTEKLEDMVSIIFLPLYFTLSGLSTNLGLLNDGITWAYTLAIIATAFVGKFGGCTLAAHYIAGFDWRESSTIGSLMSCKGLVELIVLNVGLSAGILSPRVFSMFVLESLVLTFITTPLVSHLYPPHLRRRATATGGYFEHVADDVESDQQSFPKHEGAFKTRFTVVLDKLDHLPSTMTLMRIIQPATPYEKQPSSAHGIISPGSRRNLLPSYISAQALRLIELSDRVSAVMKGSVSDSLLQTDPLLSVFRVFGQLSGIRISSSLSVAKFEDLAKSVTENARSFESDMILVPWLPPIHDPYKEPHLLQKRYPPPTTPAEASQGPPTPPVPSTPGVESTPTPPLGTPKILSASLNPFELLLKTAGSKTPGYRSGQTTPGAGADVTSSASVLHSKFVRGIFAKAKTDVALFVDQGSLESSPSSSAFGTPAGRGVGEGGLAATDHVFLPFFGGPDDRLALEFVIQLCATSKTRGTIVRIVKTDGVITPGGPEELVVPPMAHLAPGQEEGNAEQLNVPTVEPGMTNLYEDSIYDQRSIETRLQSETSDNALWERHASSARPQAMATARNSYSRSDDSFNHTSSSSSSSTISTRPPIVFKKVSTPVPLQAAILAASEASMSTDTLLSESLDAGDGKLVIVTGRSRRLAVVDHSKELKQLMDENGRVGSEVRKTIGDVATAFVTAGVGSGIVVLQAAEADDM